MEKLLHCYDDYGDFLKENYFVQCFGTIPSNLFVNLPLEINQANIESVLKELDFITYELKIVFKDWSTSANQNADNKEDYPYKYFYKSNSKSLCILLTFQFEELRIDFLYDQSDSMLEKWIIATYENIRNIFGKSKSPIFKVLSKNNHGFYTEEININYFDLDVTKMYNDDFMETHQTINESIKIDTSGLILLHGSPGTGKTSYIKSLLSKQQEKKFIFVPNDFVQELLKPDFISFLLAHKNSIFVIEDAEKVITSRESNNNSVVSTILQLTDGLFSDYLNIKIICTFNISIDRIDKALLRKGRMIAFYEFKALSAKKSSELLKSLTGQTCETEMTLAEIFNYNKKSFDDKNNGISIGFNKE